MSIKSTYPNTKTVSTLSLHQMVQTIIIYLNPEHRPHGLNQLWRPRVESFVVLTRKILLSHLCRHHWNLTLRLGPGPRSESRRSPQWHTSWWKPVHLHILGTRLPTFSRTRHTLTTWSTPSRYHRPRLSSHQSPLPKPFVGRSGLHTEH